MGISKIVYVNNKDYKFEEILVMILEYFKKYVEEKIGYKIEKVVIIVFVYFDNV